MTKEELKKEATEYALEWGDKTDGTYACCRDGYLAGAEPREKRIAELEHQLTHRNCLDCSNHSSKLRMRTLELEKENAELKGIKDVETLIRANNDTVVTLMQLNNKLVSKNKQLTKAKELIKKFSEFVKNEVEYDPEHPQEHTDLWNKLCEEAKQFLNEVEK